MPKNSLIKEQNLDFSTFIGISLALLVIIIAISFTSSIFIFFDFPSFLIVIIGTFCITTACFSFLDVFRAHLLIAQMVFIRPQLPNKAAINCLEIAEFARKHSIEALEEKLKQRSNGFFTRGVMFVIDGASPEQVDKVFSQEIISKIEEHAKVISILRKAAEIAPAMGLLGTLIGLVQMLGNLTDISKIGMAMALALITTFYGTILAYVIFFPLASKLEKNSNEEILTLKIYLKALISIAKRENPRHLETLVNSLLTPDSRIKYFD